MPHPTAGSLSRPADCFFRPLSAAVVLLATLQVTVLALSLAEIPLSRPLALSALILSLLAGGACWLLIPREPASPALPVTAWSRWAAAGITGWSLGLLILTGVAAYVMPDLSWDGNVYHLPTLQFWVQKGYVHWVDPRFPFSELANGYPKGAELVAFAVVRAFGDPKTVNMLNLFFLPLAVLAIASLSHALGAPSIISFAAGCAFILVPVNLYQSVTTYVDLAYASCLLAFLAAAIRAEGRIREGEPVPWAELPLLSGSLGLCLAVRSTGWLVMTAAVGLLAISWIAAARDRRLPAGSAARLAAFCLLLTAGALLTGGYWYVRNSLRTGSPLYPLGVRIAGFTLLPGKPLDQVTHAADQLPPEYRNRAAPLRIAASWVQGGTAWPGSIRGQDSRNGGLGFLWIAGCLPAAAWLLMRVARRKEGARLRSALVLLLLVAAIFAVTPMNWWTRFTVWIYGLGLPCLAWALREAAASPRGARLARVWFLALFLVWAGEGTFAAEDVLGRAFPGRRPVQLAELLHPEAWRWPSNYLFRETRGTLLDEILRGKEAVGIGPMSSLSRDGLSHAMVFGQLSRPLGRHEILPLGDPLSARDLDNLRSRQARYILWDGERAPPRLDGAPGLRTERIPGFWVLTLPETEPAQRPRPNTTPAELPPRL